MDVPVLCERPRRAGGTVATEAHGGGGGSCGKSPTYR